MNESTATFPDFGLTAAERRLAVFGHHYDYAGMGGERGEIWCYTDSIAYPPGALVHLYVSSTAASYHLVVARDGATTLPVLEREVRGARWQDTPEQCSVQGCGWTPSIEFRIGEDWSSGPYRFTLTAKGRGGSELQGHHLFIVRPLAGAKPGRLLQIAATGSWVAYNTWGGSNHYQGITGPKRNQYATTVSTERPWCRGFVVLPESAPRVPLAVTPPPGATPRYPHLEWAFANGYSNKYASSGWASYDKHFFHWAERRDLRSISPASTNCISIPKSSRATTASFSSGTTSTGPGRCAMPSIATSSAADTWRDSPGISCGKRGSSVAARPRFATSIALEPRIPCTDPPIRRAPAVLGRQARQDARAH